MISISLDKKENIKFDIDIRFRTAILGENGIGKSTILKSIYKKSAALDFVDVYVPDNISIAYFSQTKENIQYNKSGGEVTKHRLLELFNKKADIYLLDEPTNDLDEQNIIWLKNHILNNKIKIIFTSHDINFIDDIAEFIFYIDNQSVEKTKDKCSVYLDHRKKKINNLYHEYELNLQKRNNLLKASDVLEKKSALGQKWKSKDKDKSLEGFKRERSGRGSKTAGILSDRAESINIIKPKYDPIIKINFRENKNRNQDLFSINTTVFSNNIYLKIKTGEKILITGPNGVGKTTFLNYLDDLLNKKIRSKKDDIFNTYHNFNFKYIKQDWYEKIDNIKIQSFFVSENIDISDQYRILDYLYLDKDILNKKFDEISPGTRIKILLGILSSKNLDLIIWDEPTNHIDVMTQIILKESLEKADCAVLLVSHDKTLIDSTNFQIIKLN